MIIWSTVIFVASIVTSTILEDLISFYYVPSIDFEISKNTAFNDYSTELKIFYVTIIFLTIRNLTQYSFIITIIYKIVDIREDYNIQSNLTKVFILFFSFDNLILLTYVLSLSFEFIPLIYLSRIVNLLFIMRSFSIILVAALPSLVESY